ncbi:12183_t:CDS:1, partial [Gigaspora margarita]
LRNRFGLLTNDLLNDGVVAMMNVLFLNTSRRSRSVTPSSLILQEDLYFTSLDDWSYSPSLLAEPRDDYEFELHKDGLNLPLAYFENGKFLFVQRRSHDVPMSFTKYGRSVTSANLCADYAVYK